MQDRPIPEQSATSIHVRAACRGDLGSLTWIVDRFSPVLLAHARFRLGRGVAPHYAAEDLVQDVWAVALRRLPGLDLHGTDDADRVLAFLGRTLLNLYGNLLQKSVRTRTVQEPLDDQASSPPLAQLSHEQTGVITATIRGEERAAVLAAIDGLAASDREILVMRALEQISNEIVARQLGIEPNTAAVRYRRALARLAKQLPDSVFGDLRAD